MNPSTYLLLFLPLLIMLITKKKKRRYLANKIIKKKGGKGKMLELAKSFIGKDCIIYMFNDSQITGVISDVSGNALLVKRETDTDIVNLDFVIRIREYPRGKNGKKKSVVLD